MIRINLLPQQRPKARRASMPAGTAFQSIALLIGFLFGVGLLVGIYVYNGGRLDAAKTEADRLRNRKAQLEKIKLEVEGLKRQQELLAQRKSVIEDLQRGRVGGQELLDALANTVVRTETLWITQLERKGNVLTFEGTASSLTAVANFITQLRRSGYFEQVEIKESRQDDQNKDVDTFLFTLTANFVLPGSQQSSGTQPAGGATPAAGRT